jgi:RNA-directed DNA polymerase
LLDDFDKELEKRGLRFVRYADDCNIYVKTEMAGRRVMNSTVRYLTEKLKLKVNQQKSAVDHPWNRKFLGFTFTRKGKQIAVHESRIKRFKDKIRGLSKKMRGRNVEETIRKIIMPITRGWVNYFGIAEQRSIFKDLDGWIRRKIRDVLWRQWKRPRTRRRRLIELGLSESTTRQAAYSCKGPWRMAKTYAMHAMCEFSPLSPGGYEIKGS